MALLTLTITIKTMATHRLVVLLVVFLFGNSYLLLPDDVPAKAGWTDRYLRLALLSGCLLLTTVAAATILLYVLSAEAKAAAGWRKLSKLLVLAIGLSFASSLLALNTFELGVQYTKGRVSVIFGSWSWTLLYIMGLEHFICTRLLED